MTETVLWQDCNSRGAQKLCSQRQRGKLWCSDWALANPWALGFWPTCILHPIGNRIVPPSGLVRPVRHHGGPASLDLMWTSLLARWRTPLCSDAATPPHPRLTRKFGQAASGLCHHTFISGKPHPNGLLLSTVGDSNKILFGVLPRRRTPADVDAAVHRSYGSSAREQGELLPIKTTTSMICELLSRVQTRGRDVFVVVDSLYGSLELLKQLEVRGIGGILKCRADRPCWIFSTLRWMVHQQHKLKAPLGAHASMTGCLSGEKAFTAFSIVVNTPGLEFGSTSISCLPATGPVKRRWRLREREGWDV